MVYPFAKVGSMAVEPEPFPKRDALYECSNCGHNGWFGSDLIGVLCPRCGKSMERI